MSPRSLGNYELREEVSHGRSGETHLAWDSCDDREVTVHLLTFGEMGGTLRRRFEDEASMLVKLDHPNLVHVFDRGVDEDGAPFLVRETVHGLSLADLIEAEGTLEPRRAAGLVAKVARGLQAAHDQGLMHRDLNPASVVIDEAGEPRVTDFGLVRELSGDETAIRLKGRFLGTAGYLAPEQARAELGNLTVQTDVHGLGALLFALLTGEPPSSARTLIEAIDTLHEPAVAPSTKRGDVPPEPDAITLRCLAKDAPARYPSAAAVAEALETWLGRPEEEEVEDPLRQLRGALGWLLVLTILAPTAWGIGVWRLSRAKEMVGLAELAAAEQATSPSARLSRLRGQVLLDPSGAALEAEQLVQELPADPAAWSTAALACWRAGRLDQADAHLSRALELAPGRLEDRLSRAQLRHDANRHEEALADAQLALAVAPRSTKALWLSVTTSLALRDLTSALAHAATFVDAHPEHATAWELLGLVRLKRGDVTGALAAATRLQQLAPQRGRQLMSRIQRE